MRKRKDEDSEFHVYLSKLNLSNGKQLFYPEISWKNKNMDLAVQLDTENGKIYGKIHKLSPEERYYKNNFSAPLHAITSSPVEGRKLAKSFGRPSKAEDLYFSGEFSYNDKESYRNEHRDIDIDFKLGGFGSSPSKKNSSNKEKSWGLKLNYKRNDLSASAYYDIKGDEAEALIKNNNHSVGVIVSNPLKSFCENSLENIPVDATFSSKGKKFANVNFNTGDLKDAKWTKAIWPYVGSLLFGGHIIDGSKSSYHAYMMKNLIRSEGQYIQGCIKPLCNTKKPISPELQDIQEYIKKVYNTVNKYKNIYSEHKTGFKTIQEGAEEYYNPSYFD